MTAPSSKRTRPIKRPSIPRKHGVAELSTGHITRDDAKLLEKGAVPGQIGAYPYGFIVLTGAHEKSTELLAWGMSHAYVDLLRLLHRRKFYYLFLDRDADLVDGLPAFDW